MKRKKLSGSKTIETETRLKRAENIVWRTIDDEGVLLDVSTNIYYSLNPEGLRVWRLLDTPLSFEALVNRIMDEYDVELEVCKADLEGLVTDLLNEGLVDRVEDGAKP